MRENQFYNSNNLEKYPEKKIDICKKCLTAHVDNWDPDTYLWILQECDVPYVPDEWNSLLATYGKDKSKLTGVTILGRYLAKMKLKQWKDYRWKDTDFIQELANNKIKQTMQRQGYDIQEITTAINNASANLPSAEIAEPPIQLTDHFATEEHQIPHSEEDYFSQQYGGNGNDLVDDLTDEERLMLRLKWGKMYKPEEWVRLEQLYEEMMQSYDIQGAGHIDTLKLICKTSLKANQLLDLGDVDGAQKMVKMYDSLMKSGKFTAAQNKAESGDFVDSIGELIEMCEKQGYIERFYIDQPNDKVDLTIQDMQRYTKTLIEEETNLTLMVEKALRENAKEDEDSKVNDEIDVVDETNMTLEDIERTLKDEDFVEFNEFLESEEEEDYEWLMNQGEE